MKSVFWCAAVMAGTWGIVACQAEPVQRVVVPPPEATGSYQPVPYQKPLPPEATGQYPAPQPGQMQPAPMQPVPMQPAPGQALPQNYQPQPAPGPASHGNALPTEEDFVRAYTAHRSPRIMVFVNRTIHGDTLPKDGLAELMRVEEKHVATGGVNVASENVATTQSNVQTNGASYTGSTASNSNTNSVNSAKGTFGSSGPAEYTKTTSIKQQADRVDEIGATREDYEMIELSVIDYLDAGGRVQVKDSEMARAKLDREKILRMENGDPAAIRLLGTELQMDVLIQIKAVPTRHAQWGQAVRLLCKATSTTDATNLGSVFVDMPLPMTKTNINVFTRYVAEKMMQKLTARWSGNPDADAVEVRIYKIASVDDSLKVRKFLQGVRGVQGVRTVAATGGSTTSYAALAVAYVGAPEDLYADLKDALGHSTGLKAVDLQNNTINLEVTGDMNLVTTTHTSETKVTTETHTTEVKTVDPIRPAGNQP